MPTVNIKKVNYVIASSYLQPILFEATDWACPVCSRSLQVGLSVERGKRRLYCFGCCVDKLETVVARLEEQ